MNGLLIVRALSLVVKVKDPDFVSVLMVKEELIKMLKDVKGMPQKLSLVMKDSVYLVQLWLLTQPKVKVKKIKILITDQSERNGLIHAIFTF